MNNNYIKKIINTAGICEECIIKTHELPIHDLDMRGCLKECKSCKKQKIICNNNATQLIKVTNNETPTAKKSTYTPNLFDVVTLEWRGVYEREEGLGLVTSVPNDNMVWVCKILQDDEGMFVVPEAVIRPLSRLQPTHHKITDVSIKTEHQSIIIPTN